MNETAQCPNCGGVMVRPVTDIGVGNLPHPYLECVDCFNTVNDPPVEGLIDLEDDDPFGSHSACSAPSKALGET